jgi:hypothetical protein
MKKHLNGLLCAVALLCLFAISPSTASATGVELLSPSGTVTPVPVIPTSGGVVLANTGAQTINLGGGTTEIFQEVVEQFGGPTSGLVFSYQVTIPNTTANQDSLVSDLSRLTTTSFANYETYVGQMTAGFLGAGSSGGDAISATRGPTPGALIAFNLATSSLFAPPGGTSYQFIIATNALSFQNGTVTTQDGSTANIDVAHGYLAYAPAGGTTGNIVVPEPSSMILCVSCVLSLGGLGAFRRWRRFDTSSSAV